jgi:GntR family transcriptional regulator
VVKIWYAPAVKRAEVRDRLRQLIDLRQPGEALPSERDLSEQLGVSRPTVRAAIDDLARDGLLVRQHGRGTFTSPRTTPPKVSQELTPITPGDYAVPPADGSWRSQVITFEQLQADARLSRRMSLSPGHPLVHIARLRLVDDAPMAIERILLPADLVPALQPSDVESGSLYQLLRIRYEVVAATAIQTTEPTVTDPEESALLAVPLHSPALIFERTTRDPTDKVIEYTRSIYRGDRYRITTHLTFDNTSG